MVRPTVLEPESSGIAFSNKRWLHFFRLFVPVNGLWDQQHRIIGLAPEPCVRNRLVSQEIRAAEDPNSRPSTRRTFF